jgi:hypothetical protein
VNHLAKKYQIITKKMETKSKKTEASAENAAPDAGHEKLTISNEAMEDINEDLQSTLEKYLIIAPDFALSEAERRRLQGSGIRRYGFIDTVSDLVLSNPEYSPQFLNETTLKNLLRNIEELRDASAKIQQIARTNSDLLLKISDEAYLFSLMYYNTVRDAAKKRIPGAEAIYRLLQPFFKRSRRPGEEPAEPEVERDVHALMHGAKDGKIVIENESPHMTGGKHVVLDETHKDRANFHESENGTIVE